MSNLMTQDTRDTVAVSRDLWDRILTHLQDTYDGGSCCDGHWRAAARLLAEARAVADKEGARARR